MVDRQRQKRDDQINNRKCKYFTKLYKTYGTLPKKLREDVGKALDLSIISEIKWRDLEIGDIVFLKIGETAPADLILLDSKDEYACIDTSQMNGDTSIKIKTPFHLTETKRNSDANSNPFEFRRMLQGKIEYGNNKIDLNEFEAFIKLKKHPNWEIVTNNNFIPRGSKLRYTDWVYGMVVYVGLDTKFYLKQNMKDKSLITPKYWNYEEIKQYKFLAALFLVMLIFFIVNVIITTSSSYISEDPFSQNESFSSIRSENLQIEFFSMLQMLPIYYFLALDIINFLLLIQGKQAISNNQIIEPESQKLQILSDPIKLTQISQVTHIFFHKNSSITTGKLNVRTIGFGNNFIYQFKDYNIIKKYVETNQSSIQRMKTIAEMQFKNYYKEYSESEEDLENDDNLQILQRGQSLPKERKSSIAKSVNKKPYEFTIKNLSSLNSDRQDDYDEQKKFSFSNQNQSQYMKQLKLGFDLNSSEVSNNIFEGTRMSSSIVASKFGGLTTQPNGILSSPTQKIIERSSELDNDQSSIINSDQYRLQRGGSVKEYIPSLYNNVHKRKPRMSQTQVKPKKSTTLSKYLVKQDRQEKQEALSEQNSTTRSAQDQNSLNLQQEQNKNQTGQSLTQRDISSIANTNLLTNRILQTESKQIDENKTEESNLETPKDRKPQIGVTLTSENKSPNQNNLSGNELIGNEKGLHQNGNYLKINYLSPQNEIDKTFSNTYSNYNNTNEDNRDKKELQNISENNPTTELNDEIVQWQNQSIIKTNHKDNDEAMKIQKHYSRSISTNNIMPHHTRNYSAGMTASQYFNKDERFFSPFKNPYKNKGQGKSPIVIPQVYNSSEIIHKKKSSQNQSSNNRHKRNMVLREANYEEAKNEIDYLESLFHPDDHIHNEALIAMCLCQMTRSRYDQNHNRIMNFHQSPEEEAINSFISNFNVNLKCRSDDNDSIKYIVQFLNFYSNYQILAIMEPSKNRKRFSILVKDPNFNEVDYGSILYVRQELDGTKSVPNNFNLTISQKQQVEMTITNMLFKGNQAIIYGKREFTEVETQSIISSYNNIYNNVVVDEVILDNLFEQIENELDLLCLVGLEEEILPDVKETIEMLEKRKIKLNLFSADKISKALPSGFNIGLLPSLWKLTILTQSDAESIKYDIKEQIKEITINLKDGQNNASKSKRQSLNSSIINNRRSIQQRRVSVYNMTKMDYQKNFMIVVTQQSLKVIMEDEFLKQHFAFIYYFSKGLIGCELTNEQKSEFYSLVRMMCQEECKIMSIGQDNFNTNADINIETRENYKLDCDVRVFSFKGLQELLFYTSRLLQEMYDQILMFTINRSLVVGILWLVLRSTQQNDMMFSYRQTVFYHFPFYLFGVFNIVADKGCIGWLSQVYHKSCRQSDEYIQTQYTTQQTQMPLKSEGFIPNNFATPKEANLKNEQDFRIITSSLQFRSAQVLLQQAMLLKKLIITCLISSSVEVAVLILTIYFFGALQTISGLILPSTFTLKVLFLLINWVGQIRIMLNCYMYNLRQFVISFIFLMGISILYIFVDTEEQDQISINEAWGSPQLWFLIITVIIAQILFMIFIQFIEIRLYVAIDLFRELTYSQLNRILTYAQNLRLFVAKKLDTSSFNLMIFIKKLFAKVDMDLTIQQLLNPENSLVNNTKINRYTLSFINSDAQKRFEEEEYTHSITHTKRSFIVFVLIQGYFLIEFNDLIFGTIGTSLNSISTDDVSRRNDIIQERVYMAIYIFLLGVILIQKGYFLGMFSDTKNNGQFSGVLLRMHYLKLLLYIEIIIICQKQEFLMLFILLVYSNVHFIIMPFHQIFITTMVLTIIYLAFKIINLLGDREYFLILFQPVIVFSYFTFVISQKYLYYRKQKKNFIQQYELNIQNRKINDVLEILLPKFIINRIKSNDPNKPFRFQEKQGEASIIFCDICHFDDIIKEKNEKIIPFLDKVFKSFDKFCARAGLQKIETVGKTYMASAGLKDFEDQVDPREREVDPVERAANLALEMLDYVKDLKWSQSGKNLELKIGIHYGQVIAGVIGHHKPQFSLIGDTVNTTSRVCSKGNACQITISQEAYDRIKGKVNKFVFSDPQLVFAKGKGDITLYTLKKYNPAVHKKKQTIIRPSIIREEIQPLLKYPPITSTPKKYKKRRTSKRSLTTKYNPTTEIGKMPRSPGNNFNLPTDLIQEINKINNPIKINNFNTEQALSPLPNQNSPVMQNNQELNTLQLRNQRSQTNEHIQNCSKSKKKIEIEPQNQIEEVPNSPTSPEQLNKQIRSKNMSSFHRQHYKANNSHQGVIASHSSNKQSSILDQQVTRVHRTDSIKLVIPQLREQEDENSPTREIYKRTLHIPGSSPKAGSGSIALNGKPYKRPVLMHSGTFYVASSSTQQQQNQQQNHALITQNLIMSRHQLTGSGFQKNKSQGINTYLNSQQMYDSLHNLRQYAVGIPQKGGGQHSSMLQQNVLQQIATNCKEEVCIRYLENYQEKFQIDFLRAQQFLFNDKEDEYKQLDGQDFQELSIKDLFLKTQDQETIDDFYASVVESSQTHILQYMGLALLVCILKTIGLIIIILTEDLNQKDIGINIGFRCLMISFICFFIFKNQQIIQSDILVEQYHFAAFLTITLFVCLIALSLYEIIIYDESLVRIQILDNQSFVKIKFRIIFSFIMLFSLIVGQSLSGTHYFSSYYFFISCTTFHAFKYYMIVSLLIKNYNTMRILDSKKQQKDSLVKNLIPKHLLEYFNVKSIAQQSDLSDVFEVATLLFADITDFTKYCSMRNPEEVVNMLSNLFLKFDKKCQELKCFKVYTIGDCYVVLGVDNAKDRNPAQEANNVVQMAFNMLDIIQQVRKEVDFETLNMRIGIHTGQIIGGITGSDIVRYDIYGTDVMISNKMESNGMPGKIMVSQTTKDLLESAYESQYIFTEGSTVQDIQGYFIYKRLYSDSNIEYEQHVSQPHYLAEDGHNFFDQGEQLNDSPSHDSRNQQKIVHINEFGDEVIGDSENYNQTNNIQNKDSESNGFDEQQQIKSID